MNGQCLHFDTGAFQPHHKFLSDEVYALALDSLVKACADILIVRPADRHFFLGKRKVEPQPDWWFVGGRAKPGDTTVEAAIRNARRELGLTFPPERLRPVAAYSFAWRMRQQAPQENGTADISVVHALELRRDEAEAVVLDDKEYAAARWWSAREILEGPGFHPALKQAVLDWNLAVRREQFVRSATDAAAAATSAGTGAEQGDAAPAPLPAPQPTAARALAQAIAVAAAGPTRVDVQFDAAREAYTVNPPADRRRVAAAVAAVYCDYAADDDAAAAPASPAEGTAEGGGATAAGNGGGGSRWPGWFAGGCALSFLAGVGAGVWLRRGNPQRRARAL